MRFYTGFQVGDVTICMILKNMCLTESNVSLQESNCNFLGNDSESSYKLTMGFIDFCQSYEIFGAAAVH